MGYFKNLDIMRGTPYLLDEIAALRGEATPWTTITFDPPGTRCTTCLDMGTYHDQETGDLMACSCEVGDRKAAEIPWLRRRDA